MTYVNINAEENTSFQAYFASADGKAPGLILIQEIFGVNKVMRDLTDCYSSLGYNVLCPDIFWRIEPGVDITDQTKEEWNKAFDLFGKFDVNQGVKDLISSVNYLRNTDNCNGKVGTVGYCLGGKLSYLLSCRSNADCNVSYYGVGIEGLLNESENIKTPYLSHLAEKDRFVPKDAQQKIISDLSTNNFCDLYIYPGQEHAFARIGGEHYNEDAANLANGRTKTFFEQHLF